MSLNREDVSVAWLNPNMKGGCYWQPLFREFARLCPKNKVFTSLWPGFMKGFEGKFVV